MKPHKVLFVCIHNSARSQMAEAFLNEYGHKLFIAESAGLESGILNPTVVEVMRELGFDISRNRTKEVIDLIRTGKSYDAIITVCDAANAARCPAFPGKTKHIAWYFADPSGFTGTKADIMKQTRKVRDEIQQKVTDFVEEAQALQFWV